MKREWKWMNEKSLPWKDDRRRGTSCPHFSPPGCSLTIKVNWLHLHSELSEPSHLLGLQFHPVPAALIKSHTLFSPPPNFTFPPTVFFSARPSDCCAAVSSLRSLYLHFAPRHSSPAWVCNLPAKVSVTCRMDSASAYWHGVSHHPGSAQLPGRCCCGPCVSSSCIGTAWTWLPGERTWRQLPIFAGIPVRRNKPKKRCIYSIRIKTMLHWHANLVIFHFIKVLQFIYPSQHMFILYTI